MKIGTILHNIRSLHNVGSIFRTADAAGIEKIYLCGITPRPVDRFRKFRPQLMKVALGAEKCVSWEYARRAVDVIKELRAEGYKILAVEQDKKSVPYYRVKGHGSRRRRGYGGQAGVKKIALIFGNERVGIPPSILKLADKILEIPMRGKKESLNVSVAFGIVIFGLIHGR